VHVASIFSRRLPQRSFCCDGGGSCQTTNLALLSRLAEG